MSKIYSIVFPVSCCQKQFFPPAARTMLLSASGEWKGRAFQPLAVALPLPLDAPTWEQAADVDVETLQFWVFPETRISYDFLYFCVIYEFNLCLLVGVSKRIWDDSPAIFAWYSPNTIVDFYSLNYAGEVLRRLKGPSRPCRASNKWLGPEDSRYSIFWLGAKISQVCICLPSPWFHFQLVLTLEALETQWHIASLILLHSYTQTSSKQIGNECRRDMKKQTSCLFLSIDAHH